MLEYYLTIFIVLLATFQLVSPMILTIWKLGKNFFAKDKLKQSPQLETNYPCYEKVCSKCGS
jgi:hypothetical protein